MRTRDVYATLRELVPALVERGDDIVLEWNARADPVWRRGDRWVQVEAITTQQLLVSAGHGDQTDVRNTHLMTTVLEPIALEIAQLLNTGA